MPKDELCSYCDVTKLQMMPASQYSVYNEVYKWRLEYVQNECGISGPTAIPSELGRRESEPEPLCVSRTTYTTQDGNSCDSIELKYSVASASIFTGNPGLIMDCSDVPGGIDLCMPLTCEEQYILKDNDICTSIEFANGLDYKSLDRTTRGSNRTARICMLPARYTGTFSALGHREAPTSSIRVPSSAALLPGGTPATCRTSHLLRPTRPSPTGQPRIAGNGMLLRPRTPVSASVCGRTSRLIFS